MTDREILDKYINLEGSCLTKWEKQKLRNFIYEYKDAFSLRDEIGTCPNIKVEIDVTDSSPFFIRPFHAREEDKAILDKEMKRLCYLGILKEGFSAYSSLVTQISRKMTQDKRVVTDFRHLNMRIAKNYLVYPLLQDTFTLLGSSKCDVFTVLDLKNVFHSLRLTASSKKYCGILPYFGNASYLYQRMPMGLNISPAMWQSYINAILNCVPSKKYCEAIMDDLLLFMPNRQTHFEKLIDLLQALCKNGLKTSPKKCQLFRTELQYMGNTIFIKERRICVKPLRSRLEAVQKMKPPMTQKVCRSFASVVNFVSTFCPGLQKLLKPMYELTKKGRPFVWGDEQQKAFDEIKSRLLKPPILSMPDRRGIFLLYSDTSKFATGSALYQVQDGKPNLIACVSKRMPEVAKNYSITEVEMCSFAINIASFAHLLKRVDFDVVVDHLAIVHIMKSKMEPATNRIKKLLEILSSYSFNLYYVKGKDMILSDFLSRQIEDDSDLHEIIPISFNIKEILKENYQNMAKDTYMVQTRSQAKDQANASTVQSTKPVSQNTIPKVDKIPIKTEKEKDSKPPLRVVDQQFPQGLIISLGAIMPSIGTQPSFRPPPKPPTVEETTSGPNLGQDPNVDFEENAPHQEGIITDIYVAPDKFYLEQPQELTKLRNTSKLVQKYLPSQADIDKILNIIKRKVLKGTPLLFAIKETLADYLMGPFLKDLYRYLAQNIMPHKRHARHKVEVQVKSFILLDSLLFKLVTIPDKEKALLAITETCADKIIDLYYTILFVGHQGVMKTYLTISDKFFIPNLMHYLR